MSLPLSRKFICLHNKIFSLNLFVSPSVQFLLPALKFDIIFFLTDPKKYSNIVSQSTDDEMIASRPVYFSVVY